MVDNLYFEATGGGITFGGGEPLLRADFIVEFCQLVKADERIHVPWRITVETSLNVSTTNLDKVMPFVDHFIVDIKDMNPQIYQNYTSQTPDLLIRNLKLLGETMNAQSTIRLPLIPHYNTPEDVQQSRKQLESMGFCDFDEFEYIIQDTKS